LGEEIPEPARALFCQQDSFTIQRGRVIRCCRISRDRLESLFEELPVQNSEMGHELLLSRWQAGPGPLDRLTQAPLPSDSWRAGQTETVAAVPELVEKLTLRPGRELPRSQLNAQWKPVHFPAESDNRGKIGRRELPLAVPLLRACLKQPERIRFQPRRRAALS